jgi:hypothetical protein
MMRPGLPKSAAGTAVLLAALLPLSSIHSMAQSPSPTSTSLAVSPSSSPAGGVIMLAATVTDNNGPVKQGFVTFLDGERVLNTVHVVTATGIATLRTNSFIKGPHSITAAYKGTHLDAPSTSAVESLTVTGQYSSSVSLSVVPDGTGRKIVAAVTGHGLRPVTGSVTFTDKTTNTVLGTASLNTALLRTGFGNYRETDTQHIVFSASAVDLNNDGKLDIIFNQGSEAEEWLGNGDGTFQPAKYFQVGVVASDDALETQVYIADVNGDGNLDLIVLDVYRNEVTVQLGKGDGTFDMPGPPISIPINPYNSVTGTATGDFNGDGKTDIAIQTGGQTLVYLGEGDGTFHQPQVMIDQGGDAQSFIVGDYNGDGKPDLLFPYDGAAHLFIGHGDINGTFTAAPSYPGGGGFAGDFNADGKTDLLNLTGSTLDTMLSHGDGSFETVSQSFQLQNFVQGWVVGDFNGDGKLDVFMIENGAPYNNYPYVFHTFLGHNDGSFLEEPIFRYEGFPGSPAFAADFNGDGQPDIFCSDPFGYGGPDYHQFFILDLAGYSTAAAGLTVTLPATDEIVATYDGDSLFTPNTSSSIAVGP